MSIDKIIKIFVDEGFKVINLFSRYDDKQCCVIFNLTIKLSSCYSFYFTERGTGIKSVLKACAKFKACENRYFSDRLVLERFK